MSSLTMKIVSASLVAASLTFAFAADLPSRGPIPFSAYDLDGNGLISESEFDTVRAERMQARAEEGRPMRNAANAPQFSEFDADGNGAITPQELQEGQAARMQQRGGMGMGPR